MAIPEKPLSRLEQYLDATATGDSSGIPERPLSRLEQYLQRIATGDGIAPERPLSRLEQYLDAIANGGGGGGSSPWTKLAEQDFEISTTSTSEISVGSISVPEIGAIWAAKSKYIVVFARDKAGKRNGHYYGTETYRLNSTNLGQTVCVKSDGAYDYSNYTYGIYPSSINQDSTSVSINAKYASKFGAMDGTFHVEVWTLDYPEGVPALYA